eukprot:jgi/Ulvmu1/2700/UM014_0156.1
MTWRKWCQVHSCVGHARPCKAGCTVARVAKSYFSVCDIAMLNVYLHAAAELGFLVNRAAISNMKSGGGVLCMSALQVVTALCLLGIYEGYKTHYLKDQIAQMAEEREAEHKDSVIVVGTATGR